MLLPNIALRNSLRHVLTEPSYSDLVAQLLSTINLYNKPVKSRESGELELEFIESFNCVLCEKGIKFRKNSKQFKNQCEENILFV